MQVKYFALVKMGEGLIGEECLESTYTEISFIFSFLLVLNYFVSNSYYNFFGQSKNSSLYMDLLNHRSYERSMALKMYDLGNPLWNVLFEQFQDSVIERVLSLQLFTDTPLSMIKDVTFYSSLSNWHGKPTGSGLRFTDLFSFQDPAGIFELIEVVGNGTYGQVYKVSTNNNVASYGGLIFMFSENRAVTRRQVNWQLSKSWMSQR